MSDTGWNRFFNAARLLKNLMALGELDASYAREVRETPLDRPDVVPVVLPSGLPSAEILYRARPLQVERGPDPGLEAARDLERAGLLRPAPHLSDPASPDASLIDPTEPTSPVPVPSETAAPESPDACLADPTEPTSPVPVLSGAADPDPHTTEPLVLPPSSVILAGVGLGYHLELLLEHLPDQAALIVLEPDPIWAYLTLSRIDVSRAILAGRLRFVGGAATGALAATCPVESWIFVHPGLEPRVRWETHTIRRHLEARVRAVADPRVAAAAPASSAPLRVCLVDGDLFFEDLGEAFRQRGDDLFVLYPARMSPEGILEALVAARPHLVVSVNLVGGLAELCAQAAVPYVVWEIDPRMWVLYPPPAAAAWTHIFTWRRQHVARYLEAGLPHVDHLPLATTPAFRHPIDLTDEQRRRYASPVSFVGASLLLDNLRDQQRAEAAIVGRIGDAATVGERDRWIRALQVLRDALEAQQADLLRPVLIERLDAGWAALGLTPELEVEGRLLDLRIVYARAFGTRRRVQVISSLAGLGIDVWGDAAWATLLPPGCRFRGAADHGLELTRIYNASTLSLDIGRLYQLDIVTMRVFDILACGGFPLVEHSAELADLLEPGLEVVAWRDLRELREAAGHYLEHPAERARLVEAGRGRVLREHTVAQRVARMIGRLEARGALKRDARF